MKVESWLFSAGVFFFVPLGLVGALLWIIGRLSRSPRRSDPGAGSYKDPERRV